MRSRTVAATWSWTREGFVSHKRPFFRHFFHFQMQYFHKLPKNCQNQKSVPSCVPFKFTTLTVLPDVVKLSFFKMTLKSIFEKSKLATLNILGIYKLIHKHLCTKNILYSQQLKYNHSKKNLYVIALQVFKCLKILQEKQII